MREVPYVLADIHEKNEASKAVLRRAVGRGWKRLGSITGNDVEPVDGHSLMESCMPRAGSLSEGCRERARGMQYSISEWLSTDSTSQFTPFAVMEPRRFQPRPTLSAARRSTALLAAFASWMSATTYRTSRTAASVRHVRAGAEPNPLPATSGQAEGVLPAGASQSHTSRRGEKSRSRGSQGEKNQKALKVIKENSESIELSVYLVPKSAAMSLFDLDRGIHNPRFPSPSRWLRPGFAFRNDQPSESQLVLRPLP